MKKIGISELVAGIGFMAACIGLLMCGLAFGAALAGGFAITEHALFTPGLLCLGSGVLCLFILWQTAQDAGAQREEDA